MVSVVGLVFGLRGTATPRRMKASHSAVRCANTEHLILAFVELFACKHDFVGNVSASERGDGLRRSSSITCRRSAGESGFCE